MTNLQRALKLAEEIEREWIACEAAKALVNILQLEILRSLDLVTTLKEHVAHSHDPMIDVRYLLRILDSKH